MEYGIVTGMVKMIKWIEQEKKEGAHWSISHYVDLGAEGRSLYERLKEKVKEKNGVIGIGSGYQSYFGGKEVSYVTVEKTVEKSIFVYENGVIAIEEGSDAKKSFRVVELLLGKEGVAEEVRLEELRCEI